MQRRVITITGVVQGVGFRPFVYSLASQLKLSGFVQNRSGEVRIEIEGSASVLDQFTGRVRSQSPPLSQIDSLSWQRIARTKAHGFEIINSDAASTAQVFVSPDMATCSECRRELFDPSDRRYHYPFLNCTRCGPRLSITRCAPYDRENTTMAPFAMCDQCRTEYENPVDRRFHAQAIACPACGPRLQLVDDIGKPVDSADPVDDFCIALRSSRIGALKGIGGYHLVCSAANVVTVRMLRTRKHRDEKPLAVMFRDAVAAAKWCEIGSLERELLLSPRHPIVLLRKRSDCAIMSDAVAPESLFLGVMLPYTPLHELLLEAWGDEPLVMTSGNRSDEPIICDDKEAIERLRGIADVFLVHNRQIHVRCDDSVTRVMSGKESPIRRSRGYAPLPIKLPFLCPQPILAVGGQLKNVFGLASGQNAFLSHHMGDLDHFAAFEAFKRDIKMYEHLFGIVPGYVVHDLHPDYMSTAYALERARVDSIRSLAVQHHHAHLASCMAEHGLDGDVVGVIFDGSGFAADGSIWGGEFLVGGYQSFVRAAHLRPVRLPGGDKATQEPWRMALSYLNDAECDVDELIANVTPHAFKVIHQMIDRGFNSPWTSSAGRLFDAVTAIAGVRHDVTFEGQAAMQLEALATQVVHVETYPWVLTGGPGDGSLDAVSDRGPIVVDTRPLIRAVVNDRRANVSANVIARRFHNSLTEMIVETCIQIAASTGLDRVVLSGGVFMNALLSDEVAEQLTMKDLRVFRQHLVPPNDGGLSLGQLAIAARSLH